MLEDSIPLYLRIRHLIRSKNMPFNKVALKANIPIKRFYHVMDGTCALHADELEKLCGVDGLSSEIREILRL